MKPILTVEFHARSSDQEFDEESIALRTTEELYRFVAPGGGCEAIPDRVGEIRFTFMPAVDGGDPLARLPVTLQLGRVVVTGPLALVTETLDRLREHAEQGKLSTAFLKVIGIDS